jgi:PAS domain S-box-containing protein
MPPLEPADGPLRQLSCQLTVTANGTIAAVDKASLDFFGYPLEELVHRKLTHLLSPPWKELFSYYFRQPSGAGIINHSGKPHILDVQHKSGGIFPVRLALSELFDGTRFNYIAAFEEASERMVTLTVSRAGIISSVSEEVESEFGWKSSALQGQDFGLLVSQQDTAWIKEAATGQLRNAVVTDKSGAKHPVCMQMLSPLSVEGSDDLAGSGEGSSLLRCLLQKIEPHTEANLAVTSSATIVACSSATRAVFGYAPAELAGKPLTSIIPRLEVLPRHTGINGVSFHVARHVDGSLFTAEMEVIRFAGSDEQEACYLRLRRSFIQAPQPAAATVAVPAPAERTFDEMNESPLKRRRSSAMSVSMPCPFQEEYLVTRSIGKGSYGTVKLCFNRKSGKEYAVKCLHKAAMQPEQLARMREEISIHQAMQHPNIARIFEVIETLDQIFLVMEFVPGGELHRHIVEHGSLSEFHSQRLFKQIVAAVAYCHSQQVIHRDIKHTNILLDMENNIRLIDFGLSGRVVPNSLHTSFCGTPAYAAPELIQGRAYVGPEVDVWSLGVVLFCMVMGQYPFNNIADITSGRFSLPCVVTPECADLLARIFRVNPEQRIPMRELMEHPWLNSTTLPITRPACASGAPLVAPPAPAPVLSPGTSPRSM